MKIKFSSTVALFLVSSCGTETIDNRMNLAIASGNGDLAKVKNYHRHVDELNYKSLKGYSPLNSAVSNGHFKVVEYLIANGADCTFRDATGKTALESALEAGEDEIAVYLTTNGDCSS